MLPKQRAEHGLKFKTSSALILHYIEHVLISHKPSEIADVQCKYNRDELTLTLKGSNGDLAGNWIHAQLMGCRQMVITTDVDTEQKINLFRNVTFNGSCAYGTVVNNFDVMVHFVIDEKKCKMLKNYLTSFLRLDSSRISEGYTEIELARKPKKNDFDAFSNANLPNGNRRNRNFLRKPKNSRSNFFYNGRSSK